MKINIKKSDCFFRVDKDKRKVVCVYTVDPEIVVNYIKEFNNEYGIPTILPIDDRLYLPLHTVGIATCADGDPWEEETGREIAFTKMKEKFCHRFFKATDAYFEFHDKALDKLARSFDKLGENWASNLEDSKHEVERRIQALDRAQNKLVEVSES